MIVVARWRKRWPMDCGASAQSMGAEAAGAVFIRWRIVGAMSQADTCAEDSASHVARSPSRGDPRVRALTADQLAADVAYSLSKFLTWIIPLTSHM